MSESSSTGDPGYCLYAANSILPLLAALSAETDGVKSSSDIEYIHRCRVATRRIRSAFSLYKECFPQKKYGRWNSEISQVTKALGEARDKDVQIDFLKSYIAKVDTDPKNTEPSFFALEEKSKENFNQKDMTIIVSSENFSNDNRQKINIFQRISCYIQNIISKNKINDAGASSAGQNSPVFHNYLLPGLECLLLRLSQERKALQPHVIREIEELEAKESVGEIGKYLQKIVVKSKLGNVDIHSPYAFEKAFYYISLHMEELFWYEKFLYDSENIKMHHEMRIKAKKLRYAMEAFSDLYGGALKDSIKAVKKLQDLLGDIHDCDVWTDFLISFLDEERQRSLQYFGNQNFFGLIVPGIENLHNERADRRKALHSELVEYWDELKDKNEWVLLRKTISVPLQSSFHNLADPNGKGELKIALIGDVHANLPALESVLSDAEERGVSVILNTGDFVGYGAFPDAVVSLLREKHAISVAGNYDLSVLTKKRRTGKKRPKNKFKRVAMKWAYDNLSDENRLYLKSLPKYLKLNFRGKSLYITHGSPESVKEYITENTPVSRLKEFLKLTESDIIISGHSHLPFAKEVDKKWFINTGSVGRPEDGDPRACYALLTLEPFSIYHIRVPYDIEKAVSGIYSNNLPEAFARIYKEGKPLDIVNYAGDEKKK